MARILLRGLKQEIQRKEKGLHFLHFQGVIGIGEYCIKDVVVPVALGVKTSGKSAFVSFTCE